MKKFFLLLVRIFTSVSVPESRLPLQISFATNKFLSLRINFASFTAKGNYLKMVRWRCDDGWTQNVIGCMAVVMVFHILIFFSSELLSVAVDTRGHVFHSFLFVHYVDVTFKNQSRKTERNKSIFVFGQVDGRAVASLWRAYRFRVARPCIGTRKSRIKSGNAYRGHPAIWRQSALARLSFSSFWGLFCSALALSLPLNLLSCRS